MEAGSRCPFPPAAADLDGYCRAEVLAALDERGRYRRNNQSKIRKIAAMISGGPTCANVWTPVLSR